MTGWQGDRVTGWQGDKVKQRTTHHAPRIVLPLLIFLLALLLRVHDLDGSSFWSDEGLSLYRAQQPVSVILANTITIDGVDTTDTNPPLYFLLLHGWRILTGESVWTLRYLAVLLGVLNVAMMVPVARGLFGRGPLAVGRWRLAAGRWQLAVSSEQSPVSSLPFTIHHSLFLPHPLPLLHCPCG